MGSRWQFATKSDLRKHHRFTNANRIPLDRAAVGVIQVANGGAAGGVRTSWQETGNETCPSVLLAAHLRRWRAHRLGFGSAIDIPANLATEWIRIAYQPTADQIITSRRIVRQEARTCKDIAAPLAQNCDQLDAGDIPFSCTAGRILGTDQITTCRVRTTGLWVFQKATSSRPLAHRILCAESLGCRHTRGIPCDAAAEWVGIANDIAANQRRAPRDIMDRKAATASPSRAARAREVNAKLQDPVHTLDIPHNFAAKWI